MDKEIKKNKKLEQELNKKYNTKSVAYTADISNKKDVIKMKNAIVKKFKRIDILINNAFYNPNQSKYSSVSLEKFPLELWNEMINVNLSGVFLCSQEIGSIMAKQKTGVIVNIASIYGLVGADQRIYGKNKLLIERYGTKKHEESHQNNAGIDFRSIRFPGIISPYTIPNGGTTDFAPQMLHAAAVFLLKNGEEEYECKISADTKLPFIGIEEAINSIIRIMNMEDIASQLRSFNIQEISLTPSQIIDTIKKEFPNFSIKYNVEEKLQSVADTWPDSLNCEKAKKEWDFSTQYDPVSYTHLTLPTILLV